jgi:hypothetical protein
MHSNVSQTYIHAKTHTHAHAHTRTHTHKHINILIVRNRTKPIDISHISFCSAAEPLPAFFEGIIMTSDFLQDLICSCKGKVMCGRSCVCNEQNMCCTELCPCQGSNFRMNLFSRSREKTIFWSAKKPLVHADKGMVHLVVVEPDLYVYTLQALL